MKITKYIALILLLSLVSDVHAQSNKEPWIKRNWNNMIARFNIYFNADQKMQSAVADLALKQKDDFGDIIEIFPYGTENDAKAMRPSMEEVMKKASKVIQNKPKSKWADDAYFIIGQTQFFSGDYYAAIESFQFVNSSYTDEYIKAMSQLWLMKSYIQQDKYDDAEAIYSVLKDNPSNNSEFRQQLNLSAGDLMVKQGKYNEATELLTKGLNKLKDKTMRYRTNFVLGQLFLEKKKYEEANASFLKVLRTNAPYEYVFQANLGMARSSAETGGQGAQKTKKYLKRMLVDDKNIDYYDQIYYELAKLEFSDNNQEQGLAYMKKSSSSAKNNNTQKTKTYLFLADYYFNARDYTKAQAYYDSSVNVIPEKYPDVDKIKAKHSVLSKLIENIETIRLQDSLIGLSKLDRSTLDRQISKIVEDEIEAKRKAKEDAEIKAEQARMNARAGGGRQINTANQTGGTWYFYNQSTVARGTNDFKRTWGSRKHGDFWRFINKSQMTDDLKDRDDQKEDETQEADPETYSQSSDKDQNEALKDVDATKRKYYENIPFSATALLVANRKIENAYLNIGKIYFDELKEFAQTKTNLTKLLSKYPKTSHKPEALFYLSKTETELGNESEASQHAKTLADEFPETTFNSVLNSVEIEEDTEDAEAIKVYERMYNAYTSEDYNKTLELKKEIDSKYPGSSIQGKVDYLYALTIGKTKGKEAYLKELNIIKESYTGTEIGEMASYTIRLLTTEENTSNSSLFSAEEGIQYYVITGLTDQSKNVQAQLIDYNKNFFAGKKLLVSNLIFGDKQMFYVKQFENQKIALEYHQEMERNGSFLKDAGLAGVKSYAITEANFKILVKSTKEKEYVEFFNQKYN